MIFLIFFLFLLLVWIKKWQRRDTHKQISTGKTEEKWNQIQLNDILIVFYDRSTSEKVLVSIIKILCWWFSLFREMEILIILFSRNNKKYIRNNEINKVAQLNNKKMITLVSLITLLIPNKKFKKCEGQTKKFLILFNCLGILIIYICTQFVGGEVRQRSKSFITK